MRPFEKKTPPVRASVFRRGENARLEYRAGRGPQLEKTAGAKEFLAQLVPPMPGQARRLRRRTGRFSPVSELGRSTRRNCIKDKWTRKNCLPLADARFVII